MSDSASKDSEIFRASEVPLWYRSLQVTVFAALVGAAITFGIIYYNSIKAQEVANIFRQSRKPILQYRLEKGVWPANFSFDKAPLELETYDFSSAVQGMRDLELKGIWQFLLVDVEGKAIPKVIFKPDDSSLNALRILFAVDAQLDDGHDTTGRFLVMAKQAEFTLTSE